MCIRHRYNSVVAAVEGNPYRLPRTVVPESYKIRLVPDLASGTYTGEMTINVKVSKPTDEIVINALTFDDPETCKQPNIEITEATVRRGNGTSFTGTVVPEPKTERVRIAVNGVIGTGDWQLKLRFNGRLNDKLKGFYRSTYKDDDGKEHLIATTQFESTDFRRALPGFDEPEMKATFQLTMEIDPALNAVSNAPVVSVTTAANGKKVVEFAPTKKISTYLLAFVVGNLVSTKTVMVDGIPVRVWCRPGQEHLANFALKAAQYSLRYYRKYFGVAYPFDKLDLLAIPDFAAGAMENPGCITFRETALLVDELLASQEALEWVAHVVAHELAHMWFGDLVTMKWWNGLWLNEAFATFMETKCVASWKPEWGIWDKFGLSRGAAFRTDALKSTRPIEYTVVSPEDAEGMFDVLTYEKGASVLRMLEMFMGEETFRKGIALYIKEHSWSNTEGSDLWNALATASGLSVSEIMQGWIFSPGFPVVSVSRSGDGAVTLTQQNFKYLSDAVNQDQLWQVPVMLRAKTADGIVEMKHLLTQKEETIYLGEGLDWVVVNADGHGFYRVLYSQDLREKLTAKPFETLTVIERVNLVADEWACVQAGLANSLAFLELIKLFASETDPNVWSVMTTPLSTLKRMLPKEHRDAFARMVSTLVAPALARVGWDARDGEPTQVSTLRGDLIAALALTGSDADAQEKARKLFSAWKADKKSVDGDVIGSVVSIVAATGDAAVYDEFYQLFKDADTPEEEERFRDALTRFRSHELHQRTLAMCLNPDEIRTQDAPYLVAAQMSSELDGTCAWEFAKENWGKLVELYPISGVVKLCSGVTALSTPELEADVQAFFASHPVKGAGKTLDQYLETQRINRLLRERETPVLTAVYAKAA